MRTLMLFSFLIFAGMLHAEDEAILTRSQAAVPAIPARSVRQANTSGLTLWRTSAAALVAANVMDIHSSWGKYELNKHLAGSNGNFGKEGTLIKAALTGGLMGVEYLVARRNPNVRLHRAFAIINFGATAVVAGTAAHNYGIARPR